MTDTSDSTSRPATVILVHGAWHGAWCWAALQAELDRRGVASLAVDLPGHGASPDPPGDLAGDAAHLAAVLDRLAKQPRHHHVDPYHVVLVGHSYGGAVVTQAAVDRDDIGHLVYVAAFALDNGESVMSALRSFEPHDVKLADAMVPNEDASATSLNPAVAAGALYGLCSPESVAAAVARLGPQPTATMTQAVSVPRGDDVESTYVVCTQDNAVHPVHQEVMAARCTNRFELDTDHSPFISATAALVDILEPISQRVGRNEPVDVDERSGAAS